MILARVWSCRWNMVRLGAAAFVLATLAADRSTHLARLRLAAIPDFDLVGEVRSLRTQGRFGEALSVADAGLESLQGDARTRLATEREGVLQDQSSWIRKAKDVGLGALTGSGTSLERLLGAVTADFFIVGDVRDLAIQGAKSAAGDDPDELIVLLSGAGVVTTLAPEIDWVPSLLKVAKKSGAIGRGLEQYLIRALKAGDSAQAARVCADLGAIASTGSPGLAASVLKGAASPEDLARVARFARESGREGTLVLHLAGAQGATILRGVDGAGEAVLRSASRKGKPGLDWVVSGPGRVLLRPHPILGLLKGLEKGTIPALAQRAIERVAPHGWWVIPLAAGWILLELRVVFRKICGQMKPRAPVLDRQSVVV